MTKAIAAWNRFWFAAECGPQIRLFRGCFAVLLLLFNLTRGWDLELFYSDSGLVPLRIFDEVMKAPYRFTLLTGFHSTGALWAIYGAFLVSLALLAFGVWPRLSALVALVLHLSFMHRDIAPAYGVDNIASFYLFFLILADHRHRAPGAPDWRSTLGSMAYRLGQLQLCVIYGYSGFEKLRGNGWWSGEAIWTVLANNQLARYDFSWTVHFPLALALISYATLLWEIYFPVLIWVKGVRYPLLIFGVLMHLGIAISMNIPYFGFLMAVIYGFFLDPADATRIRESFGVRTLFRRIRLKFSPR